MANMVEVVFCFLIIVVVEEEGGAHLSLKAPRSDIAGPVQ